MHRNSIEAYRKDPAKLAKRAAMVMKWYGEQQQPKTDRECAIGLGFVDMNAVRPTITHLVDDGLLVETGSTVDHVTSRRVRVVRVSRPEQQP